MWAYLQPPLGKVKQWVTNAANTFLEKVLWILGLTTFRTLLPAYREMQTLRLWEAQNLIYDDFDDGLDDTPMKPAPPREQPCSTKKDQ